MVQSWESLMTDMRRDRQTNESDFIGSCPTNVEHQAKLKNHLSVVFQYDHLSAKNPKKVTAKNKNSSEISKNLKAKKILKLSETVRLLKMKPSTRDFYETFWSFRNNHAAVFCKKFITTFVKFTGIQLWWRATLSKRLNHTCYCGHFSKQSFFKTSACGCFWDFSFCV